MDTEFSRFPVYFYGYNDIETFCLSIREQLVRDNLGLIFGILRGGGIPALMLSQMLCIPVHFLHYDRREARTEINNDEAFGLIQSCINERRKILLVDDIAGTGYTLANCHEYLLSFVKDKSLIKVLTLVHHKNSRTKADYYKDCSAVRAILPWERYVTSRVCFDDFVKTGEALIHDQCYKKTLAINDPGFPLILVDEWKVDHYLEYDGDDASLLDTVQIIGPEEIYCNSESLINLIIERLPFVIFYKVNNSKRYRIIPLD